MMHYTASPSNRQASPSFLPAKDDAVAAGLPRRLRSTHLSLTYIPELGTIVPSMGTTRNLLPLEALFGRTRQRILSLLYGSPDQRFFLRQIIRFLEAGSGGVQRELEVLTAAHILTRTLEGRQTYFQANVRSPIFQELQRLFVKTSGVAESMREALAPLQNIVDAAFIFGSFARGEVTSESDIDIMVIGRASLDQILESLAQVPQLAGREVNPLVYTIAEFADKLSAGHHFVTSVMEGPKVFIIGAESDVRSMAAKRLAERAQNKPARNRRPPRHRRS